MQKATKASDAGTLSAALRATVAPHGERVAFRSRDGARTLTWSEVGMRVDRLAGGLPALGLRRGETVAIMSSNRPELQVVDLAAVLPTEWAAGGDELTPTLKLRRRPIAAKYRAEIGAMYEEDA